MPSETVKLTAYGEIVNLLFDHAWTKGITSLRKLKTEKHHKLREEYPGLPHYLYTAARCPAGYTGASGLHGMRGKLEERMIKPDAG